MNTSSSSARLRPFRPVPFGRYTLLSQLATGGMGEIFLARLDGMQGFEKLCVIKKILPQLAADPEFVERFMGEARTLVKLSHGSIAQVLDMGVHEGEAYMALEYVDGKDLRKVASRARDKQLPLPASFVLFVMNRVLDALAYAHRKRGDDEGELNLVHRDISPQNILISYEGEVKVIDFGLAKSRLSAAKTNPSIILGKFLYMSPEQARHRPVDRRSDLYAVGLCLYELLSGKNPFEQLPPGELMSAVAQPEIAPLSQVVPSLPASLAQLVMKALAVEPAQRFQSAEEMRGRLGNCLMELDPAAGPENISQSMHELFASEYLTERRTLLTLREVGRAPEPEPVVIGMPEGVAPRPMPSLPPKTIRLDGPVEALSFKPTPRTHEGGPGRDDGETRPAVVVDEATRPAVDMDAIEASRRERLEEPPDFPMPGSVAPTRELQLPPEPPPAPPPAPLADWLAEEEAGQLIEDTPAWSDPLPPPVPTPARAPEPPKLPPPLREARPAPPPPVPAPPPPMSATWEEVPEAQEWEPPPAPAPVAPPMAARTPAPLPPPVLQESELPVMSLAELAPEGFEPTHPRAQRPQPPPPRAARPESPARAPSPDVYHQDTQPRVVLDESLMRDSEQAELPQNGRPRPSSTSIPRVPRRRVTSTGISVVVPPSPARSTSSSMPRVAVSPTREARREQPDITDTDDGPLAAHEPPEPVEESAEPPGPPGRSAASSRGRLGWIISLSVLGVVLVACGGVLFAVLHPERVPQPLRARLLPLLGVKKPPVEPSEEEPADPSALSPVRPVKPPASNPPQEAPAQPASASASSAAPASTPPPATTPTGDASKPVVVDNGLDELPIPSLTPTEPPPGKRPVGTRKRSLHSAAFKTESNRMIKAMKSLLAVGSCDDPKFKLTCNRYYDLDAEKDNEDVTESEMIAKMRNMTVDLNKAVREGKANK